MNERGSCESVCDGISVKEKKDCVKVCVKAQRHAHEWDGCKISSGTCRCRCRSDKNVHLELK